MTLNEQINKRIAWELLVSVLFDLIVNFDTKRFDIQSKQQRKKKLRNVFVFVTTKFIITNKLNLTYNVNKLVIGVSGTN